MFEPSTTTCCEFAVLVVIRRVIVESSVVINAVFFDFGGVILASPFEAFNRYESTNGLPRDFIRRVNAADPHSNAWARLERSEISGEQFDAAFAAESERFGHRSGPGAGSTGGRCGRNVLALDRVIEAGYTRLPANRGRWRRATGRGPVMARSTTSLSASSGRQVGAAF